MPALVPRAEDLLMSWVWPQPSRSSQSNGAHEWTILIPWERDAVMTHAVPVECGQRQGVPSSPSGILHAEQTLLKLKSQWKEWAVLSQANCNYLCTLSRSTPSINAAVSRYSAVITARCTRGENKKSYAINSEMLEIM